MPKFFPLLISTLTAAVLLAACGGKDGDAPKGAAADAASAPAAAGSAPRAALTVTVATPQKVSWAREIAANGNIAAWQEASIGADVAGLRLQDLRVNVGDVVKKGQVLATFDAAPVQQDQAQARASLAEAEAAYADARGNAERARAVQASGALSQQQINQYATSEKTARARVEAAKAVVASQNLRVRNTQIVAPDAGVISARTATVGQVVGAGTELFRMVRQGRLEWRGEARAEDLSAIRPGQRVRIELPGHAADGSASSGTAITGTVRQLAPTVDARTRYALVYVDLPPGTAARAGMFASGHFDIGADSALTVPQESVVMRDGFAHLAVLQPDRRVRLERVQTGRLNGNRVEIMTALPAGAQVVVRGAGFLNDGDQVQVVGEPATAAASAAASAPNQAAAPAQPAQAASK
ncbi:efflux RND transporter periplasmic adaptor subunit [Ottowia sp. GY511]|uniref:Efflux RND transporter periplasmic adaptor subunit n=2 Tax=Ottowia TaxID=219181 RepID=A0ABW4KW40_9BURK|nr:efflux RND transporter periplasmic adaptor subunit [Ottowia sp. GY511]